MGALFGPKRSKTGLDEESATIKPPLRQRKFGSDYAGLGTDPNTPKYELAKANYSNNPKPSFTAAAPRAPSSVARGKLLRRANSK